MPLLLNEVRPGAQSTLTVDEILWRVCDSYWLPVLGHWGDRTSVSTPLSLSPPLRVLDLTKGTLYASPLTWFSSG